MKVLTVIGARPQFIKAATVSRIIEQTDGVTEVVVHTGQHFDSNMSDIFFEEMELPRPNHNLNISSLTHGAMTGRMLEAIESLLLIERPDWVLVYGDTNSTLAGALAASKLHINVAHVEAGLRSFNNRMPEEQNRVLADRLSTILFSPTASGMKNLEREGYSLTDGRVVMSGDVMLDAALFYKDKARRPLSLDGLLTSSRFALATVHRAENTDDYVSLANIVSALNQLHTRIPVVFPIHPRTRVKIEHAGLRLNCHVIDPVGYLEMVYLLRSCDFVISDSGGLQKEAFFFQKQCIILRRETEWTELVDSGVNVLTGTEPEGVLTAFTKLDSQSDFSEPLYGNGKAAELIVSNLCKYDGKFY